MRLAALAVLLLATTPVFAGAKEDSRALYDVAAAGSLALLDLLDRAATQPAPAQAAGEIGRPVAAANARWLAAMRAGDMAAYAAFMPCSQAAVAVEGMAEKLGRFLDGGAERPALDLDAGYFREDLSRCELALGLTPTFPDIAQRLAAEGDE